jgi:hypothetical protein
MMDKEFLMLLRAVTEAYLEKNPISTKDEKVFLMRSALQLYLELLDRSLSGNFSLPNKFGSDIEEFIGEELKSQLVEMN